MFQSFDGWKAIGDKNERAILAHFTKDDGETVRYGMMALRRMNEKPSQNMTWDDKWMVKQAVESGPSVFRSFDGWKNLGRRGHPILLAHFTKASGEKAKYNIGTLKDIAAHPAKKFSDYDDVVLKTAIQDGPAFR